jgi:hypothetical protein
MATRNERRSGKPAKFEDPKAGPKSIKATAASMKGAKKAGAGASSKRGKR